MVPPSALAKVITSPVVAATEPRAQSSTSSPRPPSIVSFPASGVKVVPRESPISRSAALVVQTDSIDVRRSI